MCVLLRVLRIPDGSQLIAGVGARVLIYEANDGELLHALKGHKASTLASTYTADCRLQLQLAICADTPI